MSIISTQLVSALNNYNSIVPIVTKDLVENGGRTIMAYHNAGEKTRKYEATEKFLEANMASALWYGAIPFIKKAFDATFFKFSKLQPQVSLQLLEDSKKTQSINNICKKIDKSELPENFYLKKGGKLLNTKQILNNVSKNAKTFKALHVARLILSTAIPTYLSAVVLPKTIIALTQWKVNKDNKATQETPSNISYKQISFKNFDKFVGKSQKTVSFKSLKNTLINKATQAQTSLLGDMVAVDLAISGSRVYYANKREKEALAGKKTKAPYAAALEKIIREGGFLYLIYFGGNHIKNAIDKATKNKFDPVVLEDKNFATELKTGLFKKNPLKDLSEAEQLKYIDKYIDDDSKVFIKYAKKMKLISTVKDEKGKLYRNPLVFLDTKKLNKTFQTMADSAAEFLKNGQDNIEKYILKKAKTKRIGVYGNLVASSFAVCYVLPKIMYGFRKWYTGNNEDPGINKVIYNAQNQ